MLSPNRTARLLEAGMVLSSELSLAGVLQRLVELAAELTSARYGAIGVIDASRRALSDFVTTGLDAGQRKAIGALPKGHGILGALIEDPRILRLRDIAEDPRSVGFPPNHPSMHSFLGAPVTARGRVFGNVYVAEKQGEPEFTAEDEETLTMLAAQAAIAVENARLYDELWGHQRWLEAIREISLRILAGDATDSVIQLVAHRARALVGADSASVVLPSGDGALTVVVADGAHADELLGMVVPTAHSASGEVIRTGRPLIFVNAAGDPRIYQPMAETGQMGPAIFVPMAARGDPYGTLALTRMGEGRPFDDSDVDLLQNFAEQAAIAIEYGRAQRDSQQLSLLEDRERIAKELHDGVIQALFAVGLGVQATAARLQDEVAASRLQGAVNAIDGVIGDLRSYIFGLRPGVLASGTLADALEQLGHEFQDRSGVTTVINVDATLEPSLRTVAPHLIQLARESLSNVERHAGATTCRISLHRSGNSAVLEVDDDGTGFDVAAGHRVGMGLSNLRTRAESLGAELTIDSTPAEGTTVRIRLALNG
jgi:signal transduction histidine kinase